MGRRRHWQDPLGPAGSPLIVGATGGSGTRALVRVLERAGCYMGVDQNHAGDAMHFEPALDRFINPVLRHVRTVRYAPSMLPDDLLDALARDLLAAAARHLRAFPGSGGIWGFKNPRLIYLLPVINEVFNGARFVHLVRDGRDMALSTNRNQLNKHYKSLFDAPLPADRERAAVALWTAVNVQAANFGRYVYGDRYLEIRFEDLCRDPETQVSRLLRFADPSRGLARQGRRNQAHRSIAPPSSLGRWQALERERADALAAEGRRGLDYFGYDAPQPVAAAATAPSPPVIVLGMHRGGTSATMHVLADAGWTFGSALMASTEDNPQGYWENEKLVAISHRLLALLGRDWSDPRPLPKHWMARREIRNLRAEAAELLRREFPGQSRWAAKDPRMSLLARFWVAAVRDAVGQPPRCLLVLRHPLEVSGSLERRDGLSRDAGLLLWIGHMREAEASSRGLDRLVVSFDDLLRRPSDQANRILEFTGTDARPPRFGIRPELRHFEAAVDSAGPGLAGMAVELYRRLLDLRASDSASGRGAVTRTLTVIDTALAPAEPIGRTLSKRLQETSAHRDRLLQRYSDQRLRGHRERDLLATVGGPADHTLRYWASRLQRHRARDDKVSLTYRGYAPWLQENYAASADRTLIERYLDSSPPLPGLALVVLPGNPASRRRPTPPALDRQSVRPARILVADRSHVAGPETEAPRHDGSVAGFLNACLEICRTDYVALLRPGWTLCDEALTRIVSEAATTPGATMYYGDEDELDPDGTRTRPWFKSPARDADEHLERDRTGGLVLVRRDALDDVGGFSESDAADPVFALALRLQQARGDEAFRHVAQVLTSRPTGDAEGISAVEARAAVLRTTPELRAAEIGSGSAIHPACVRIGWRIPDPAPLVTVIVPTRDGGEHLERCLHGLLRTTDYPRFEIVIVDNGSTDARTLTAIADAAHREQVRVLRHDAPFNYPELNQLARDVANGTLLCLMNDDVEAIDADWLREMVGHALRPEVGCVGALLLNEDATIQHAGVVVGMGGGGGAHYLRGNRPEDMVQAGFCRSAKQCTAVTAACMVMRTEVYDRLGGLDRNHLPVNYNDVDFCLRLWDHGLRVLFTPYARLWHLESATRSRRSRRRNERQWRRDLDIMQARWGRKLGSDRFLNPNVSDEQTTPTLSFPPRSRPAWKAGRPLEGSRIVRAVRDACRYAELPTALAYYRAAELALEGNRTDIAIDFIARAARDLPDDSRILQAAALIHRRHGDLKTAERLLHRLIDLHPGVSSAPFNLANLYREAGAHDRAARLYRSVIRLLPTHLGAHLNLAAASRGAGQTEQALEELDQALRIFPNDPRLLLQMGVTYLQRGETGPAILCLRASNRADPGDAMTVFNLGTALKLAGRLDEAKAQYEGGIQRFGASEEVILNYGNLLTALGDQAACRSVMQRFADTAQVSTRFLARLADVNLECGELSLGLAQRAASRTAGARQCAVLTAAPPGPPPPGRGDLLIDANVDLETGLFLLPCLERAAAMAGTTRIFVPAVLHRLAERVCGNAEILTGGETPLLETGAPVPVEALPRLLGTGIDPTALADRTPLDLPAMRPGRIHIDLTAPLSPEQAAGLPVRCGSQSDVREVQGPAESRAAAATALPPGSPAPQFICLPERWDRLDRLHQLAAARLVITDRHETALLARLVDLPTVLIRRKPSWLWVPQVVQRCHPQLKVVDLDSPAGSDV